MIFFEKQLRNELCKIFWISNIFNFFLKKTKIDVKEIELLDKLGNITNLNNKIHDYERTIEQFRALVRYQQDQLSSLREKEADTVTQASELHYQSESLMKTNLLLQSKLVKSTAIAIDRDLAKLNASQAEAQLTFIKVIHINFVFLF